MTPFTNIAINKTGARQAVVEDMIALLRMTGKQDVLPFGYSFAALILKEASEKDWLQRRFHLMHGILEESWAFQEMVSLGYDKANDRALNAFRKTFMHIVQKRFPGQVEQANQVSMQIHDVDLLQTVSNSLLDAESEEEAQRVLMQALKQEE